VILETTFNLSQKDRFGRATARMNVLVGGGRMAVSKQVADTEKFPRPIEIKLRAEFRGTQCNVAWGANRRGRLSGLCSVAGCVAQKLVLTATRGDLALRVPDHDEDDTQAGSGARCNQRIACSGAPSIGVRMVFPPPGFAT